MRWIAIIAALTLSAPAFGQPSVPNSWYDAISSLPAGKTYNCDAWHPGTREHAVTTLAVRISSSGDVVAASVQHTSGNPALDAAALACSRQMYIAPATAGGQPVEVTWIVLVTWSVTGQSDYIVPRIIGDEKACEYPRIARPMRTRAPDSRDSAVTGTVGLVLHLGADGKVQNATVARSSGALVLDDAAVRCASAWEYPPALIDGHPTAVDWPASIAWR